MITSGRILFLWFFLPAAPALGQELPSPERADSNFHIYILMGQSNMAGRGEITEKYRGRGHERLLMLDKNNRWVPAKHPLHFDKPKAAGVGPGLSFGIAMAKARAGLRIGLVPCAVGGTSINRWQAGAFDKPTGTRPWDDAVLRIAAAMKAGTVRGILWHQGEGDSSPEAAAVWLDKLAALIGRLREETGNARLPFVAGELGRYRENYGLINQELARLPEAVPFTSVVSSRGLRHKGDGTHLKSSSASRMGKRFAKEILALEAKAASGASRRLKKSLRTIQ
ncbi:MAG TPA: sialate O-acetylesterase [Anseongella sp.]|nr:sialate O-acetylesterase [Anseongella sp.]